MLKNYPVNSKSLTHSRKNSNKFTNIFHNRPINTINQQKVARPVYIPPPQYKYSLAKSPIGKNNFEPGVKQLGTASTNALLGGWKGH
jgi:hypothetical protein